MTTRQAIVENALKDNGLYDGAGYPGPSNHFDQWLERPNEYSCADGVTYWFAVMGLPLPLMSWCAGKQTGTASCPCFAQYARDHGAVIPSTAAKPGDVFLFDWNGDGKADHIELVTANDGRTAETIGADSGPSNIDGHHGEGGVHRHRWTVPNGQILIAVDTGKLVTFAAPPPPAKPHSCPDGHAWTGPCVLNDGTHFAGGCADLHNIPASVHVEGWHYVTNEGWRKNA